MRDPDEDLGMALHFTRMIRLGLEAMWSAIDALPDDVPADPGVRPALLALSQWLERAEQGSLRKELLAKNYFIVRPVSLANPPPAESLAGITAAIDVLNRHQLVITTDHD
jgi:hypothetical protein